MAIVIAAAWVYRGRVLKRAEETAAQAITIPLGEPVHEEAPALLATPSPSTSQPVPLITGSSPSAAASPGRPGVTFPVMPSLKDVAAQVKLNPHALAPGLMNFAASLGQRMETALGSEDEASRFFPELQSCALARGEQSSRSAQALCLENARVLSERYSSLGGDYEALKREADPAIVRLAK